MSENRPSAASIQSDLDLIVKLYPAARDLTTGQASGAVMGDFTTGGSIHDLSDVIRVTLSQILDGIDTDVNAYAKMLVDADRTVPDDCSVVGLLRWLKIHIGFFTHGDDAMVAYEFEADIQRWRRALEMAADPGGRVSIDTGEACQESDHERPCEGTYRISVDREQPLPYDLAFDALRKRDARCSENPQHVIAVEMLPMVRRWMARL